MNAESTLLGDQVHPSIPLHKLIHILRSNLDQAGIDVARNAGNAGAIIII